MVTGTSRLTDVWACYAYRPEVQRWWSYHDEYGRSCRSFVIDCTDVDMIIWQISPFATMNFRSMIAISPNLRGSFAHGRTALTDFVAVTRFRNTVVATLTGRLDLEFRIGLGCYCFDV